MSSWTERWFVRVLVGGGLVTAAGCAGVAGCGGEAALNDDAPTASGRFPLVTNGSEAQTFDFAPPDVVCNRDEGMLVLRLLHAGPDGDELRARLRPFGYDGGFASADVSIIEEPGHVACAANSCAKLDWKRDELYAISPGTLDCAFRANFSNDGRAAGTFECPQVHAAHGAPIVDILNGSFACTTTD